MEHFNWTTGFWFPYINFFIFLFLAIYFFKKPLANLAKGRREKFEEQMRIATEAKRIAEEKLLEIKTRYQQLDQELALLREQAEEATKRESERIVNDARALADHLKREAQQVAAAEVSKAKDALQQLIVESVREKVLATILSEFDAEKRAEYQMKRVADLQNFTARN